MFVLPILLFVVTIAQAGGDHSVSGDPQTILTQPSGPGLWIGGIAFAGEDIASAEQSWDDNASPTIVLTFTDTGRAKFLRAQESRLEQQIEIAVDGQLISSPYLLERIEGHEMMISGTFTVDEAKALARRLRGLPASR